jgi:hypothetical protein
MIVLHHPSTTALCQRKLECMRLWRAPSIVHPRDRQIGVISCSMCARRSADPRRTFARWIYGADVHRPPGATGPPGKLRRTAARCQIAAGQEQVADLGFFCTLVTLQWPRCGLGTVLPICCPSALEPPSRSTDVGSQTRGRRAEPLREWVRQAKLPTGSPCTAL